MSNSRKYQMFFLLLSILWGTVVWCQSNDKAKVIGAKEHVAKGEAARNKQDYTTAIVEFRKAVEIDPDNFEAHSGLASSAVYAYQHALRVASQGETVKAGAVPAPTVQAAEKQLQGVHELYLGWAKRHPEKAAYQYALGVLSDQDFEKKQQYFLKAVQRDPGLTQVYSALAYDADLRGDDHARLKYLKKAAESEPVWALRYAIELKGMDFATHQKLLQQLKEKYKGNELGAQAIRALAEDEVDPKAQIVLYEQLKEAFPPVKSAASRYGMRELFDAYARTDSSKAVSLSEEMVASLPEGAEKKLWQSLNTYQKNLVQARSWMGEKRSREAVTLLERTPMPRHMDPTELELLKAEAAGLTGDPTRAYMGLLAIAARQPNDVFQTALLNHAAALGKKPQQVEIELREARMKKAFPLIDLELPKYPDGALVRSVDYRGRVVMLNFWYPL